MPVEQRQMSPEAFSMNDAPGGDLDLNAIFADPDLAPATPVVTPPAPPEAPVTPEPFLKNATGSVVYQTAEDAIKGIEHKDALLDQLRQQVQHQTGYDPLKPQKREDVNPPNNNYGQNPKLYFEDLQRASATGDEAKILEVQQKFVLDTIAPFAPVLTNAARSQAVTAVTSDVPDFTKFLGSEEYNKTLDNFPLLKQSIQMAEQNPQAVGDLAQLYRMSHDLNVGRNVPQIVQERVQVQPVAPARPTVSSTPMTPAPQGPVVAKTPQERWRTAIEAAESQGIADRRF